MTPAPRNPNTAAATAAVIRRGQETKASRLREAGWIVIPPETAHSVPTELRQQFGPR